MHSFRVLQQPPRDQPQFWQSAYRQIYVGVLLKGSLAIFWFVTGIFFTHQIYNIFRSYVSNRLLPALIRVCYGIAVLNQYLFRDTVFPWATNVCLCALLFFYIGDQLRHCGFDWSSRLLPDALPIAAFGVLLCLRA